MDAKQKFLFAFAVTSLFSKCANPVLPSGGAKDSMAPKLLHIESQFHHKKSQTITLTFNEHIKISDPKEHVFISPPVNITSTKHVLDNLYINVKPSDSSDSQNFRPEYLHILPGFIKDLNEGNTYNTPICIDLSDTVQIDSNYTVGQIQNIIPPFKTQHKVYYLNDKNTKPSLQNAFQTKVYEDTKYIIPKNKIDSLKYILFLDDKNKNNNIDTNEYYSIHSINKDSLILNYSYCDYPKRLNIEAFRQNNLCIITGISGAKFPAQNLVYYQEDTALLLMKDTLSLISLTDEHGFTYKLKPKVANIKPTAHLETTSDTSKHQTFTINRIFNYPFNDTIIILYDEDSSQPQPATFFPPNQLRITRTNQKIKEIIIPSSDSISGTYDNPSRYTAIYRKTKHGSITFERQAKDSNSYIIYLSDGIHNRTSYLSKENKSITNTAPVGKYLSIIITDLDRNGLFTKSSIENLTQEEPSYLIQDINITENLDNTIIIQNTNK